MALPPLQTVRHRRRPLLALLALPLVSLGMYFGARGMAPHAADHVTVSITSTIPGQQTLIYQQTFGAALATEAQHLINDLATPIAPSHLQDLGDNLSSYTGPIWRYHLTFTWMGVTIETADMIYDGTPEFYTISLLGMQDANKRSDVAGLQTDRHPILSNLARESGSAIPLPPAG